MDSLAVTSCLFCQTRGTKQTNKSNLISVILSIFTNALVYVHHVEQTVMSVEEDSEPILGLWFEETLSPSEGSPTNTTKEANNEPKAERATTTIVPDNREPHGVGSLFMKTQSQFHSFEL